MKRLPYQGFTLIELMIVVAIVGVLASFAYPAYVEYGLRARRGDAKVALLGAQLAQEKWRASNPSYGSLTEIGESATSPEGYYAIAISGAPNATSYTMTATSTFTDADCAVFAVNQDGKITGNSSYAGAQCWNK